jgi:hypothetical protein
LFATLIGCLFAGIRLAIRRKIDAADAPELYLFVLAVYIRNSAKVNVMI